MLERDVIMYMQYARRHRLPTRRLQLQMALVAQMTHNPANPLTYYDVDDRTIKTEIDTGGDEDMHAMTSALVAGGNVIRLKGWKKKG